MTSTKPGRTSRRCWRNATASTGRARGARARTAKSNIGDFIPANLQKSSRLAERVPMTDSEAPTNGLTVRRPQLLEDLAPLPPASEQDVERAARVLVSLRDLSARAVK